MHESQACDSPPHSFYCFKKQNESRNANQIMQQRWHAVSEIMNPVGLEGGGKGCGGEGAAAAFAIVFSYL